MLKIQWVTGFQQFSSFVQKKLRFTVWSEIDLEERMWRITPVFGVDNDDRDAYCYKLDNIRHATKVSFVRYLKPLTFNNQMLC